MLKTIQSWWIDLKNWTLASTVGIKKEEIEIFFESEEFFKLIESWEKFHISGKRYPQVLRGTLHKIPPDRPDIPKELKLPIWLDYEVHEWEGPGKTFGWTLFVYTKDGITAKEEKMEVTRRGKFSWTELEKETI